MNYLDLFSGIGGFALAAQRVWGDDHEIAAFCEKDEWARKVLHKHWPDVPQVEDICTLDATQLGPIDILTGGWPCQDNSNANSPIATPSLTQ